MATLATPVAGLPSRDSPAEMLLLLPLLVASSSAKSPYVYQADPMARVAMEHRAYTGRSSNPYMVGEQFFKKDSIDFPGSPTKPWEEGSHGYEGEQLPYTTMQNFGSYERRHYPAAMMACTYDRVDNAAPPRQHGAGQPLGHHDGQEVPQDAVLHHVPPPLQVHQRRQPGGRGDVHDAAGGDPAPGGQARQARQRGEPDDVLLPALQVPAAGRHRAEPRRAVARAHV